MTAPRYASILGLGFGDCGKGLFVDALARRWQAHTVVRFSGGAQAGHNVITPDSARRHHTFSQWGAATFVPGVRTLLLDPMVVHPTALLVEAETLARAGVPDALGRLGIDARCRVTTPFHQAAGRLREWLRGSAAHGTCGVGVGETVRHALEHPGAELRYGDFAAVGGAAARSRLDRLQSIRAALLAGLAPDCPDPLPAAPAAELAVLRDETLAARWLTVVGMLARQCPPQPLAGLREQLHQPGCVLFEGAQGVLLDEWRGFHPHTTWSSITTAAVASAVAPFELPAPVRHLGVLRTYPTRHGAGPLPTHDESLDSLLPEPHNHADGWQGRFRRGHPDAVLLRYALEVVGPLDGLLVSHLDVFPRGVSLRWCDSYRVSADEGGGSRAVEHLPPGRPGDLVHQERLTELLSRARPNYAWGAVNSVRAFLDALAGVTPLPVVFGSHGPTAADVRGV